MGEKFERAAGRRKPLKKRKDGGGVASAKGQETRERILDAALEAFGEASFLAVTTRQIASAAAVSLPTLQYYFGDKEGLYRACAKVIVERFRTHTAAAGESAAESLREGCSREIARSHLKALMTALGKFLVGSNEPGRWAQFVSRELRDPGPAFEILYAGLWRPGIELTARLIANVSGVSDDDPAARIQALLLIYGLLAFQSGRKVSLRTMDWASIGPSEAARVLSGVEAQIDAIAESRTERA